MTTMRAELDRAIRALNGRRHVERRRPITAEAAATIESLVRATHGLIGAEALQRATAVSRRQAAAEKARVVTAMERDRKARCGTVVVAAPGRIRGFDAMYVWTLDGWRYLLIFADSAVCYRTTIVVAKHYDAESVAAALELDIVNHGAPLAYRLDRARCHDAPAVRQVLDRHSILGLHGPAHHPGYYGQLERQNREHRAWLDALGTVTAAALAEAVEPMMRALNALWPRRTLGWVTAEARWNQREPVREDRAALQREVDERRAQLTGQRDRERHAIEQALRDRGHLNWQIGGRC